MKLKHESLAAYGPAVAPVISGYDLRAGIRFPAVPGGAGRRHNGPFILMPLRNHLAIPRQQRDAYLYDPPDWSPI
ncbi:hypothetical protein EVAR_3637_1 [Eumeta japonica]|uniref:Uncharacterized protein n=1 Tax=Eumeta variegata TaxID=151549 RepID=A0A4C1SWJ1_EUMVA|nr:hypothetical protein EVAR_3637_1 [Eumeta japonica]